MEKGLDEIFDDMKKRDNVNFSLSAREKEIDEFLSQLKELWLTCPQQRFTQILFNYTKIGTPINAEIGPSLGLKDFFYYKDKDILENIVENTKTNKEKQSNK